MNARIPPSRHNAANMKKCRLCMTAPSSSSSSFSSAVGCQTDLLSSSLPPYPPSRAVCSGDGGGSKEEEGPSFPICLWVSKERTLEEAVASERRRTKCIFLFPFFLRPIPVIFGKICQDQKKLFFADCAISSFDPGFAACITVRLFSAAVCLFGS